MTLNGVMALILRYFTQYDVVVKKVTFAISSPDEFLVIITIIRPIILTIIIINVVAYRAASAACLPNDVPT